MHLAMPLASDPRAKAKLAGGTVVDLVRATLTAHDAAAGKRPAANVAVILTILAAAGGMASQHAAFALARERGKVEDGDLIHLPGPDGRNYFSGNLVNQFVWESQDSLLSVGLGAFAGLGQARVVAEVHRAFADNAAHMGKPEFGRLRGRAATLLGSDPPIAWLRVFWPNIAEALSLYELAPTQWPLALGFAIKAAAEQTPDYDDPAIKLGIILGCAIPMSKLDPASIGLQSPLATFTLG